MNNEPKAGKGIDPEMLAAYIDNRLPPEQRAAVEAQLAIDPESRALLVDTLDALDDDEIRALEVKAPLRQAIPFAPKPQKSRVRTLMIAGAALAAAASLILVLRLEPGLFDSPSPMEQVVAASHGMRRTSGRLSGAFTYAQLRAVRSSDDGQLAGDNWELLATVTELERQASPRASEVDHALGTSYLLLRRVDEAIEALRRAARSSDSAELGNDLAVALLERFETTGDSRYLSEARLHADRAVAKAPTFEPALFTRALILDEMNDSERAGAWQAYLSLDSSSGWADEARRHSSARVP